MLTVRYPLKTVGRILYRSASSASAAVKEPEANGQMKEDEDFFEVPDVAPRKSLKKFGKLEPFMKNLFLGRFDAHVLKFPQALDKERHETLHEMVDEIEKFFEEQVDSKAIDTKGQIPVETMDQLKNLGLFGQQIPEEYGGLGLGATEFSRIGEVTAMDGAIAVTLAAHQSIGLKGLLISGSDYLKEKYLPRLSSGELTAAFCLTEPGSGSDAGSIQTRATLSEDGKTWRISGGKIWITNGGIADVMTVFARTEVDGKDKVTAFFVERNFGGITSGKPEDKMGIRGSNTCEVHFDETPVPAENVIGTVGGGLRLALTILNSGRFTMGTSTSGVLKKCMQTALAHARERKQFNHALSEFGLMKEKFAKCALDIYAMESMAYLSAGMIDQYEESDTAVEAAIVKVFSSAKGWEHGSELLQVLGGLGYMKDYPYERFLRDGRITLIFEGTNEILRMFIALMGIQHAAPVLKENVKKARNPLVYPTLTTHFGFRRVRDAMDSPKHSQDIAGQLHPSLRDPAQDLEYCVERFRYVVEDVLSRYATEVVKPQNQSQVVRLGDIAIELYAMTAVLSRANRSHIIGLHMSDHEILLATTFCTLARRRILDMVKDILMHQDSQDPELMAIADAIIQKKGYVPTHPLTTNGW